jgi:predicted aspartyl protease
MAVSPRFTSSRFPYLPVHLRVRQLNAAVQGVLDTGFDGDVAVPVSLIPNGELPDGYLPWAMADGSEVLAPAYDATVQVASFAAFPAVVIALGEEPLVGRGVSDRFTIILDHGRELTVEL